MKKLIRLLAILIIAISACGGSGGSVTHPVGYAGPNSSVAPLMQTASVYSETHYIYDFQGNNYLLSCNSNGVSAGQLEIYKDISGSFNTTEKMTIGGGIGCSGVTAIIDNNNSVFNSTNIGVLHIFATEDVPSADTFVTYWCWDGTWAAGGSLQGCGSNLPNTIGGGAPAAAIDTTNNTLLLTWQEGFDDLAINMELLLMDYPLANLQTGLYNFADWTNYVSIDGANGGFSSVGTSPVVKIAGGSIVIIARADNAGLGLKLYHCLLTSDCSDANNWAGSNQFVATNVTDSFDFEINPSTGYLTLVYQSNSDQSNLHPNAIVYREWSISTPLTAGPEKLIAMAYDPVNNLAAAKISLGIEPSGKKHVFWWEHQAAFDFVLNHRFAKGNLWGGDGDIVMSWDGSSLNDIPINMNPVFDNALSPHGDRGFHVGYSRLNSGVQEFVVSTRYPTY